MDHAKRGFMSPTNAARVAKRARLLHRRGGLTHAEMAVFETMLWDVRQAGTDRVTVTYAGLCKLARVCRQSVADAVASFVRLGLITKIKRKVLVLWANGGRKWQQQANEYVFCCESGEQTEITKEVIHILMLEPAVRAAKAARESLVAIAASRMRKLGLAG